MARTALELGCGVRCPETKDFGKVDLADIQAPGVTYKFDFNKKFPIRDNSYDFIWAHHVLEHVWNIEGCMNEIWRILKPGGVLEAHMPHYLHPAAWGDMTHRRGVSRTFFHNIDVTWSKPDKYSKAVFSDTTGKVSCFAHSSKGVGKAANRILSFVGNRFPRLYERFLIHFMGAPEEIIFRLKAVK